MYIDRVITRKILESMIPGKVVVLLGARRVGKTVLLRHISEKINESFLMLNGEDFTTHDLLAKRSTQSYKNLLGDKRVLFIDEAQKIPEIGAKLKLMVDEIQNLKIMITGSSAFDIQGQIGEPLTGRQKVFTLYPICEKEFTSFESITERDDNLRLRLVYGNYPEVIQLSNLTVKTEYLKEIINSYLLKDILAFENIKNSSKIINLLRLIAYQVGSEVSLNEIGKQLQISRNTVEKYLDILSKVFILFKLTGFSRNLRKEIVKNSKWYFYDNGIRNAVVANFNQFNVRDDCGALWENYILSERIKFQNNNSIISNNYFWRTYDQQEIDLIEEREGSLFAYELKWKLTRNNPPKAWINAYPKSNFKNITKQNYFEWVV
ncbi:MAG: ATP-binding protein [Ignavibacteria bacterium]|nr:ATP-binding protein [Ignavibacteria bacterium]